MTQVVVEETIMAVAKWLVNLVNRTLESKATAPRSEPETPTPSAAAPAGDGSATAAAAGAAQTQAVDQLLAKFSCLIEQSCDRAQSIALIESRLQEIETALHSPAWEEPIQILSQAVVKLDSRLAKVEQMLGKVDLDAFEATLAEATENEAQIQQWADTTNAQLTALNARLTAVESTVNTKQTPDLPALDKLSETLQYTTTLEDRLAQMEKLVARLRIVPKYVESNYRSILFLQNCVKELSPPIVNGHRVQQ
jgi:DNA repair exonuclease SbcCD ATPase subunit